MIFVTTVYHFFGDEGLDLVIRYKYKPESYTG